MKRRIVLFAVLLLNIAVFAQKSESETISNLKSNQLVIDVDHSQVSLFTWDKQYIKVTSNISINGDTDNEKHDLIIENEPSGIVIKSKVKYDELERRAFTKNEKGEKVSKPLSKHTAIMNSGLSKELEFGYDVEGVFEIYIPQDLIVDVRATFGNLNISGEFEKLEAHSVYGLVDADLIGLNSMQGLYLKATYDIVDLTIDASSNANLNLITTFGEVYTDLPISFDEGKLLNKESGQCKSGKYTLNSGELDVIISATYSDIYVRKSK